jgi:hypothetical protein
MNCPFCDEPEGSRCRFCSRVEQAEQDAAPFAVSQEVVRKISEECRPLTAYQETRVASLLGLDLYRGQKG